MISHLDRTTKMRSVHKYAHKSVAVESLPSSAILWEMLRKIESELTDRGLTSNTQRPRTVDSAQEFHPLWFIAETEKNIFLWRHGFSLIEQDEFEFWIDVPKLIAKRLAQIENGSVDNPFTNPLWGSAEVDQRSADKERDYLIRLDGIFGTIRGHAHALSCIASLIAKDSHQVDPREIILLPQALPSSEGQKGTA